ncbi:MAG: hypothetical protein IJW26_01255 [Clostridia bacterium]|nr:hypothetical protein [Clostridia bacterium]
MKNIYSELENYLKQLNEINAKVLGLSRQIINELNEHDEYKSSFKVVKSSKWGETKNSVVSLKEQEMFTIKDTKMRERRGGYEVRFRKNGYDKSFFSTSKTKAIEKAKIFLKSLNQTSTLYGITKVKRNKAVDFFEKFFNDVKRNTVKEITYKTLLKKYNIYVKPHIINIDVENITAETIQTALNNATPRVKEDVKTIFNQCLEYAIGCKIITFNPCKYVKIVKHIRENGKALSSSEIATFKESIKGSDLEIAFLIFLYTGIRACEYSSIKFNFDKGIATVLNGKVKSGTRQTERQIPILKPLYEYKNEILSHKKVAVIKIQRQFHALTGGNLKNLRHTFATCCRKFVDNELVSIWQGHTLKNITASVYTHFDITYQIEQAQKIDY